MFSNLLMLTDKLFLTSGGPILLQMTLYVKWIPSNLAEAYCIGQELNKIPTHHYKNILGGNEGEP